MHALDPFHIVCKFSHRNDTEAACEEDAMSLVDSCSSDAYVGSFELPDASSGGGDGGGGAGGVSVDAGSQDSELSKVRAEHTRKLGGKSRTILDICPTRKFTDCPY